MPKGGLLSVNDNNRERIQEILNSSRATCYFCKKPGATVGLYREEDEDEEAVAYTHLPCALDDTNLEFHPHDPHERGRRTVVYENFPEQESQQAMDIDDHRKPEAMDIEDHSKTGTPVDEAPFDKNPVSSGGEAAASRARERGDSERGENEGKDGPSGTIVEGAHPCLEHQVEAGAQNSIQGHEDGASPRMDVDKNEVARCAPRFQPEPSLWDHQTVPRLKKLVGALLVSPEATRNERVVSLAARLHVDPERLVAMNETRKVFEGKERKSSEEKTVSLLRRSSRLLEKTVLEYLCEYRTQGGQRMDQVADVFAIDVDILVKLNQTFAPRNLTLAHDTLLADGTVLFIPPFPGKVARKLSDLQDSQGGLLIRKCIICDKKARETPVQNIINCASCAARWAHRTCHSEDILRCNECNGSDKRQHPPKEKTGDSAVEELLRFLKKDATISKLNDSKKMMENLCKWVEENDITLADLKKQAADGGLFIFIPSSANLPDGFKMQLYMRLTADASASAEPKRAEQSEGGVQPKQSPVPTGKIPRKNQMARQPEHRERAEPTGTGASPRHKENTSQRTARRPPPLTGVSSRLPAPLGS